MRIAAVIALTSLLSSCADWTYERIDKGELKGRLIVEWIDADTFVFRPDQTSPLVFKRKNNEVIQPAEMITDGGTVPAALRAIKSYSPWGYAPAFIIHDWLFAMKHCKLPGYEAYDHEKAAMILAEVVKTMMEKPKFGGPNKMVLYSMYEAVRGDAAKSYWDNGACESYMPRTVVEKRSASPADKSAPRTRSAAPKAALEAAPRIRYVLDFN